MPELDRAHIHAVMDALCQLYGPSGLEAPVRDHVERIWRELGVDVRSDRVGNLLGRVGGSGPRVLLQAHMDQIGYMVRHVTDDGFVFLESAQGNTRDEPEQRFMVGQRALVIGREGVVARGVLASPSGHALTPSENHRKIDFYRFFLDAGFESRAEAEEAGIHIGAAVIWEAPTRLTGNRITTPAVDDRAGLAAIQLALERLERGRLGCELWVAATVMEEKFLHGAQAIAATERFDAVIALDNTPAGDIPVLDPTAVDTKLGAGPVVVFHDHLIAYSRELAWALHDAAAVAGIPIQHGAFSNFTTDGVAFLDSGSPTVALGPATRYTHTAYETVDVRDIDATANLLVAYVASNGSRREDG